ncbi:MAG: DUF6273 domain-containing protein [Lachnospiraceae bacterium]|nr:DUF6273 domain-containing protein [Lachnospiraceae bacterium]
MAILKCKMCGGDIDISSDKTVGTCEYCGCTMTLPKVDDDQRANAFNRANHFRRIGEFDKALDAYERIVREDPNDAEAHWCCAISRFGIEYVKDPATSEYIPTCHRLSYDSFLSDVDYLAALDNTDSLTRAQYEKQAAEIAEVQKGILATSQNEEPFDVFICYKESENDGTRTVDSTLAQDIYYRLHDAGYRVFFSRITLEDMVGKEYEPYIFAALNSAKVMVVIGTTAEHLNAVWVKNEWSRYLALMKKDRSKNIIPCYRDMDPYDMPEELSILQSYDMSKIGFIQDLIRGIKKVVGKEETNTQPQSQAANQQSGTTGAVSNSDALLKRSYIVLGDGDFNKASQLFEEVLNQNPECAEAYFGLFLIEKNSKNTEELSDKLKNEYIYANSPETLYACDEETEHIKKMAEDNYVPDFYIKDAIKTKYEFNRTFKSNLASRRELKNTQLSELNSNKNLAHARQYADKDYSAKIDEILVKLESELDNRIKKEKEKDAENVKRITEEYKNLITSVDKDVIEKNNSLVRKLEKNYANAVKAYDTAEITKNSVEAYENAKKGFLELRSYKNSPAYVQKCDDGITQVKLNQIEEAERERLKKKKRKIKITTISISSIAAVIAVVLLITKVAIPEITYSFAKKAMKDGNYKAAITKFENLSKYKYSKKYLNESKKYLKYNQAMDYYNNKKYEEAVGIFEELGEFNNSKDMIQKVKYDNAMDYYNNKKYSEAVGIFEELGEFNNSKEMIQKIKDESVKNAEVGNTFYFGKYWWKVLYKQDGNILIISDKVIKCVPFNKKKKNVYWSTCTLRKYLNSNFINNSFSKDEMSMINTTTLNTKSGRRTIKTKDKVFCLSKDEVNSYIKSDNDKIVEDLNEKVGAGGCWWLRTQGYRQDLAMFVGNTGVVHSSGITVDSKSIGICPAMWIHTN